MSKKIYVGNLNYNTSEEDLRGLFSGYGKINTLNLITDTMTGRSKGFGFVEMEMEEDADKAIAGLNGHELDGRQLKVNEAQDSRPRSFGGAPKRNKRY